MSRTGDPYRVPSTPTYTSQLRTRSSHTCAAGWSAAGKSAISTITCPAAEIARSASATYDPLSGSSAAQRYATRTPATGHYRPRHPSQPAPPLLARRQREARSLADAQGWVLKGRLDLRVGGVLAEIEFVVNIFCRLAGQDIACLIEQETSSLVT